jgi:hypothetical protein
MHIDSKQLIKERKIEVALDGVAVGVSELSVFVNSYVKPGSPHSEQRLEALRTLIEFDIGIAIAERRTELQGLKEGALKRVKEGVAVMNSGELDNLQKHIAVIFRNALAEILNDGATG